MYSGYHWTFIYSIFQNSIPTHNMHIEYNRISYISTGLNSETDLNNFIFVRYLIFTLTSTWR